MTDYNLDIFTKELTNEEKSLFYQLYNKNKKNIKTSYLLLIFLGVFGVHKLYLDKKIGVLYLILLLVWISPVLCLIDLFLIAQQTENYNQQLAQYIINLIKTLKQPTLINNTLNILNKNSNQAMIISSIIGGTILLICIMSLILVPSTLQNKRKIESSNTNNIKTTNQIENIDHNNIFENEKNIDYIQISSQDLYREYEQNEARADSKYTDKPLKITGKISDIHKITNNIATLSLYGNSYGLGTIDCDLETNNTSLINTSIGKTITIIGKVNNEGLTLNAIQLKDGCYIDTQNHNKSDPLLKPGRYDLIKDRYATGYIIIKEINAATITITDISIEQTNGYSCGFGLSSGNNALILQRGDVATMYYVEDHDPEETNHQPLIILTIKDNNTVEMKMVGRNIFYSNGGCGMKATIDGEYKLSK